MGNYADFLTRMNSVRVKMNLYYNLHTNVNLENISSYVAAGVLDAADENFLDSHSAVISHQTGESNWVLQVQSGTELFLMMQDGCLCVSNRNKNASVSMTNGNQ